MAPLIFIYNIFLIVIYTCVAMLFAVVFVRSHKKNHLAIAILFFFYLLDNTIVYMAEFISSFGSYYANTLSDSSIYKTIIISIVCFCYLFIKEELISSNASSALPSTHDWAIYGAIVLWYLIIPEIPFFGNIWFYYIAEPLFLVYLCGSIFCYWIKYRKAQPELTERLYHYRYLLVSIPLFSICIMVEDAIVLFHLPPLDAISTRLRQRNACEDILSLVFVGYAIYAFFRIEKGLKEVKQTEEQEKKPETIQLPYLSVNELDITGFSKEYSLTKRESQVLKLLLEDKSNQEMQEILVIAPGTVKNHIHNIYSKTNVSKRSQLLMLVSEFTRQGNTL